MKKKISLIITLAAAGLLAGCFSGCQSSTLNQFGQIANTSFKVAGAVVGVGPAIVTDITNGIAQVSGVVHTAGTGTNAPSATP